MNVIDSSAWLECFGEGTALEVVALMLQGRVIDLSAALAIDAARLSLETGLAPADSIILATARSENAVLWTQDATSKD